jgi:hypothetical protein
MRNGTHSSRTSRNASYRLAPARAYSIACIHEHACVRCSLLRPTPAQRARLEEIRDNLQPRIAEAIREGWLGEVEGLQVSLASANDKLQQLDSTLQRQTSVTQLGLPTFTSIAGRASLESAE